MDPEVRSHFFARSTLTILLQSSTQAKQTNSALPIAGGACSEGAGSREDMAMLVESADGTCDKPCTCSIGSSVSNREMRFVNL